LPCCVMHYTTSTLSSNFDRLPNCLRLSSCPRFSVELPFLVASPPPTPVHPNCRISVHLKRIWIKQSVTSAANAPSRSLPTLRLTCGDISCLLLETAKSIFDVPAADLSRPWIKPSVSAAVNALLARAVLQLWPLPYTSLLGCRCWIWGEQDVDNLWLFAHFGRSFKFALSTSWHAFK
jgi:hypothetical protein